MRVMPALSSAATTVLRYRRGAALWTNISSKAAFSSLLDAANETVGIQYELAHRRSNSIDPRELQFTQSSHTVSQFPPKGHQAKRHLDRLTFGGGAQVLLSTL